MIGSIHIRISPYLDHYDHAHRYSIKHSNIDKVRERVESKLKNGINGLEDVCIQVEPSGGIDEYAAFM